MLKVILGQARKEHWRDASLSIAFYAVGALLPVWLSLLLRALFSQPLGFGTFLDNGQFAIYSAAALSPVVYLLLKPSPAAEKRLYVLLAFIGLIFSACLFSGLTVVETLNIGDLQINVIFLRASSITIYLVALTAMFFVDLHENVYQEVNIAEDRQNRQGRLEEEFDRELHSLDE